VSNTPIYDEVAAAQSWSLDDLDPPFDLAGLIAYWRRVVEDRRAAELDDAAER
jgi:hypothetical protein